MSAVCSWFDNTHIQVFFSFPALHLALKQRWKVKQGLSRSQEKEAFPLMTFTEEIMRSTEGKERLADYSSDRIHALTASLVHDGTRQYALFPQVKLSLIPLRKWKGVTCCPRGSVI